VTDAELKVIEDRANAANPPPWTPYKDRSGGLCGIDPVFSPDHGHWSGPFIGEMVDGEFVAHAREDVPALIAEVRRLREALKRLRAENIKLLAECEPLRWANALCKTCGKSTMPNPKLYCSVECARLDKVICELCKEKLPLLDAIAARTVDEVEVAEEAETLVASTSSRPRAAKVERAVQLAVRAERLALVELVDRVLLPLSIERTALVDAIAARTREMK
jgi:hypothetical protein